MTMLKEKSVKIDEMYKGNVFVVEKHQIIGPDGRQSSRDIIRHNGGAAILALDSNNMIPMVWQFRLATGQCIWEIPAGKVERGEDILDCAKRELAEETGCRASIWKSLGGAYPTPGYSSEKLHLFLARDLEKGELDLDDGEYLELEWFPFEDLFQMVMDGEIVDGKSIQAILLSKQVLEAEAKK